MKSILILLIFFLNTYIYANAGCKKLQNDDSIVILTQTHTHDLAEKAVLNVLYTNYENESYGVLVLVKYINFSNNQEIIPGSDKYEQFFHNRFILYKCSGNNLELYSLANKRTNVLAKYNTVSEESKNPHLVYWITIENKPSNILLEKLKDSIALIPDVNFEDSMKIAKEDSPHENDLESQEMKDATTLYKGKRTTERSQMLSSRNWTSSSMGSSYGGSADHSDGHIVKHNVQRHDVGILSPNDNKSDCCAIQ